MRIDRRLLGWGVFFILLGAIPLAYRAQLLTREQLQGWFLLWPILVIGWGLGLLLIRTPIAWLGGAITAITFGIMGGAAIATGFGGLQGASGCGGGDGTTFPQRTGILGSAALATIEFSCGTLTIGAVDGNGWTVDGTDHNGGGPRITSDATTLAIETPDGGPLDGGRTVWNVALPRAPSTALDLTFNAGSGTVDLEGATISSLSLTVNAGSLTADLSTVAQLGDVDATLNLGSAALSLPAGTRSGSVALNGGSLDLCLPPGSGVEVEWNGALASNNLAQLGFTQVDDRTWRSPGLNVLADYTKLRVNANAGSFELQLEGVCRA